MLRTASSIAGVRAQMQNGGSAAVEKRPGSQTGRQAGWVQYPISPFIYICGLSSSLHGMQTALKAHKQNKTLESIPYYSIVVLRPVCRVG